MTIGAQVFQCDRAIATSGSVDYFDPEVTGQPVTVKVDLYAPNTDGGGGVSVQGELTLSYEPAPFGLGHVIPLDYNKRYAVTINEWDEV